jgi:hypothetical protein
MQRTITLATVVAVGGLLAAACTDGAAQARAQQASSATRRDRPTSRSVERAFARVQDEVARCLTADVPAVRAVGAFDGDDGGFALESLRTPSGAEPPFTIATCVRTIVERARVRPFRADSERAEREFSATITATSAPSSASSSASATIPTANSSGVITSGSLRFGTGPEDLVRREHDALQRCFEQASEQAPSLEGEVEVRFTLDARGRVLQTSHRVSREHNGNGLFALVGECIEAHVRLIAFGAQSDGGSLHVVPIAFGGREHFAPAQTLPVE